MTTFFLRALAVALVATFAFSTVPARASVDEGADAADAASQFGGRKLRRHDGGKRARLAETLGLTAEQKTHLLALSDSLTPRVDKLIDEIADMLASAGSNPDPMVVFARMSGKTNEGRKLAETAIGQLHSALSPDQWAKLPDSVKTPPTGRGLGGGGEGGGRGGQRPPQ